MKLPRVVPAQIPAGATRQVYPAGQVGGGAPGNRRDGGHLREPCPSGQGGRGVRPGLRISSLPGPPRTPQTRTLRPRDGACPRRTPSWLFAGPEPLGPRVEPRVEFQA